MLVPIMGWGGYNLWQAVNAEAGVDFLFFVLQSGLAVLLAGLLVFRLYGLLSASYTLDLDGVRLRWGLRAEDIPGNAILWAASEREAMQRLHFPFFRWPGAVVGTYRLPDGRRLEFMADRGRDLVLIATHEVIYIVSPDKTHEFLKLFEKIAEQGVIAPLEPRSEDSGVLLTSFWTDLPARSLVVATVLLAVTLAGATALIASARETVVLHPEQLDMEPVILPSVRLMLLPVLNTIFASVDLILGLFFYRSFHLRPLAYLMWTAAVVSGVLFVAAVGYTLLLA